MNKGIMGIRIIIAIVGLSFAATTTQAGTNSWKSAGSGFWDTGSAWSLNAAPSSADIADFVTNSATKIVTIDSVVVSDSPATLTISNLTVAGIGGATNTLFLNTSGTNVPLHVFNAMLVSNAAVLQITNSFLQVDGGAGGIFTLTGSMKIFNGARVQLNKATISGAALQFALGTITNTVAVSSDLTLGGTLNVINGGGFTNTTYTLFTYGGIFTSNLVTIGTTPNSNFTYVVDTSIAGKVNLIVAGGSSSSSTATVQLISIVHTGNDIAITWSATGGSTSLLQSNSAAINGSYTSNGFADISSSQFTPGGTGVFTNTYIDVGGAANVPPHYYRVHYFQ